MNQEYIAEDGSVFRTKKLMDARNEKLEVLRQARERNGTALGELRKKFSENVVAWCAKYIVYTKKDRENLYRVDVPGAEVSVFWDPVNRRLGNLDWEGFRECTPWQMRRLLENLSDTKKALVAMQNARMQADSKMIDLQLAELDRQLKEMQPWNSECT